MKSLKQKKSLLASSTLFGMIILLSFQCTSNKKSANPVISNPSTVLDTISNPNNSSPNHSENEGMVDSIKKVQLKLKKKKVKKKTNKKEQ